MLIDISEMNSHQIWSDGTREKGHFGKSEFLTDTKLTYQKDPQCLDAVLYIHWVPLKHLFAEACLTRDFTFLSTGHFFQFNQKLTQLATVFPA